MCVAQVVSTLATKKPGETSGEGAAAAADAGGRKSFVQSFKQSGGNGIFFVGCDCGTAGCVIFDQGKEMQMGVCRPVKAAKVAQHSAV